MAESEDPLSEVQEEKAETPKAAEEPQSGEGAEGGDAEASAGEEDASGGEEDEATADDSSEEDEEGPDEYEQDDFLVGEGEDEEEGGGDGTGGGGDGKRRKRKRRKSPREFKLDDEDYDLLEDAQVMLDDEDYDLLEDAQVMARVKRPAERTKRLKRRGGEEGERTMGAQQLKESLFGAADLEDEMDEEGGGGDGGDRERDRGVAAREPARAPPRGDPGYFGDELSDEMDDFIDDGDGEAGRQRRRRRQGGGGGGGFASEAMAEAARIFGDATDLHDLVASRRAMQGAAAAPGDEDEGLGEEGEEGLDGEDYDDDAAADARERRAALVRERQQQRLLDAADPEYVAAHYLTSDDEAIRAADRPERLQLALRKNMATLQAMSEEEFKSFIEQMAKWVYENVFSESAPERKPRQVVEEGVVEVCGLYTDDPTDPIKDTWPCHLIKGVKFGRVDLRNNKALRVSRDKQARDRWRNDPERQRALRKSIESVLTRMLQHWEEVPVIAMYRKELCGELLAMRRKDEPQHTGSSGVGAANPRYDDGTIQPKHRRIRRWDVLWTVAEWGLRYIEMYDLISKRTKAYAEAFDRAAAPDAGADPEIADALAACGTGVNQADSLAAVGDWHAKFLLMQGAAPQLALAAMTLDGGANGSAGFHGGRHASGGSGGGLRRPPRLSRGGYPALRSLGFSALARRVAISPLEFAENIDEDERTHEPEDPDRPPAEFFEATVHELDLSRMPALASGEALLKAMQSFLADELAAEPALRAAVRNTYFKFATVSTEPTEAGEAELDAFHRLGGVKRLRHKPLSTFEGADTFMRIAAAAKAGYITYSLALDDAKKRVDLIDPLVAFYVNDKVSEAAEAWNAFRAEVVALAVNERLLPVVARETERRLEAEARDVVLAEAADALWDVVRRPPLRLQAVEDEDGGRDEDELPVVAAPRVMAVVWGPGGFGNGGRRGGESAPVEPTTVVQLDGSGNLVDLLTCPQLSGRIPRTIERRDLPGATYDPADDPKKAKDSVRIRDKLLEHYPNAVVVGASSPHAKQLMDDLTKISQHTERKYTRQIRDNIENQKVEVLWAEEAVAALWAVSAAARAEFPEHTPLVRRAVALGRMQLDPLAVLSSLCGRGGEVLSLRLHAMQDRVAPEDLARAVEKVMVTAMAQCGVDINAAAAHPWRQPALQFVPGLGPRKAGALIKAVARSGNVLESRLELREEAGEEGGTRMLGPMVFNNAAPFIRVRAGEVAALANYEFDAQDDSRIHPEREVWLKALHDAFYSGEGDEPSFEAGRLFEEGGRKMLATVDIYDFAKLNGIHDKLSTLLDLYAEIMAPYGEVRLDGEALEESDVFYSLHGETKDSFKVGQLVEARVRYVDTGAGNFAKLDILPNEIEGLLDIRDAPVAENENLQSLMRSGLLALGATVRARVKSIGMSEEDAARRFIVGLSMEPRFVEDGDPWERRYCQRERTPDRGERPECGEPYYVPDAEARGPAGERRGNGADKGVSVAAKRAALVRRMITHPLWKHEVWHETVERMRDMPDGSTTFRPAAGAERFAKINMTVKLATLSTGPLWLHLSLLEPPTKPRNKSALVTPLTPDPRGFGAAAKGMEGEVYDDLDEVVARFVEPLAARFKEVMANRKFQEGTREAVDKWVEAESVKMPTVPIYCISLDPERSLSGRLTFKMPQGSRPHHELFVPLPRGVWFRGSLLPSVEHMLTVFKKDPNHVYRQAEKERRGHPAAAGGAGPGGPGGLGYGGPPPP
ncbi:MAG: hypothetical protein J3K34DRAFT_518962, partial [Monoraphidium minutum]